MLKNMKKVVSIMLMSALLLTMVQITAFGDTAPATPERQFNEDFEDYQILKWADEYKTDYYAGTSVYSSVLNIATPSDPTFYETYASKYPNGTASVYEGNLADRGMAIPDPSGEQVLGGTKNIGQDDGWYGNYEGPNGNYNIYNRRLTVMNRFDTNEINQSQYASLNPKADTGKVGKSELNRNNVALDGYSYLTARVNLSIYDDKTTFDFGHAGIALTKNPNTYTDNGSFDIVYFTDSETEDKLDVYFNNAKVGEVAKSSFKYTSKVVTSSGEWYTIQYRIYNKGTSAMHKLSILDDVKNTKIVDTEWVPVVIPSESTFNFNPENKYGIRFYAHAEPTPNNTINPRMRIDDISFHNGGYIEDFDSYNISRAQNASNGRIGNGAKGNRNTTAYANGVYEGNMAKNVFVHHVLKEGTADYTTIFGNITQWQGYVAKITSPALVTDKNINGNIDGVRDMLYSYANSWDYPVAIVSPTERGQTHFGFNTQALVLRADGVKAQIPQTAYAGMEYVDFSDKTTISAVFKIEQARGENDSFKVQLTKGRDQVGAGSANYTDNSFEEKVDVFEMKNNNFYFGGNDIGDYEFFIENDKNIGTNAFRFEYTVNLTDKSAPKHELKIFNNVNNALVAHVEEAAMNLPSGFDFENSVYGFRFVNDAPTATGDIMTYIDDVKVEKELSASLTGKTSINDAMYSATTNKFTCVADLANAIAEPSVFVFGVYNNDNILQKVYSRNYDTLSANANNIDIDVADDYDSANYYGKLFFWNNFTNITPITESTPVILK